jgi:hypothetical protein
VAEFPDLSFTETVEMMNERWSRIEPHEKKRFEFMAGHKPKRAITCFLYFGKEIRNDICLEFPDYSTSEISRIVGERWRHLSPKERRPFDIMHDKEKARFLKEMKEYKLMLQAFKT